ncbi:hypothetical protein J2T17_004445 [Paenibacillus mucilaginosus]
MYRYNVFVYFFHCLSLIAPARRLLLGYVHLTGEGIEEGILRIGRALG